MRTCRGTFNGRAHPGGEWAFRTGNEQLKKAEFCHLTGDEPQIRHRQP